MSIRENGAIIAHATKRLLEHWETTQTAWRDAKRQEFEEAHLAGLPEKANRATATIEELDVILKKIRHACE